MSKNTIQYKHFFLNNGLGVILLQRPERHTAGLVGFIKAGSAYESERLSGVSHFVEHLLFRGNKKYKTPKEIEEQQEKLGLSHGAHTNYDEVFYNATFPPSELASALEFVSNCLFTSNMEPIEVEKERQVMFEEEKLREDNLVIRSWDLALKTRLKNKTHPLTLPREGLPQNIKTLSAKTIKKFYEKHFNPINLTLAIGSNLSMSYVEKVVKEKLEVYPSNRKICRTSFTVNDFSEFKILSEKRNVKKAYVYFTMPAFSYNRSLKDRLGLTLLMGIFRRIRLTERLYHQEGLSYDWGASWAVPTHPIGFVYIYSSCDPKNLFKIIKTFFEELKRIKNQQVLISELKRLIDYYNKTQFMEFDSLHGALDWFLSDFYYYQKFIPLEEIIKTRNKITPGFLLQIAKEVLNFENLNVTVLGPITQNRLDRLVKRELAKI